MSFAQERDGEFRIVWKHLPASADAIELARSAMAAHEQGRFWEFVDAAIAGGEDGGLDDEAFAASMWSDRPDDAVQRDMAEAIALGIDRTPTLVINGRVIPGAPTDDALERLLLAEAARAGSRRYPAESEQTELEPSFAGPGSDDAPVQIQVIGDYSCAYCAVAFELASVLVRLRPGQVRVGWVNRPDPTRPESLLAAKAALAAAEQGRFWPMHRLLLAHPGRLERADAERYAAKAGLELPAFVSALESERVRLLVLQGLERDVQTYPVGMPLPTFVVNGRRISGLMSARSLASVVEAELHAIAR